MLLRNIPVFRSAFFSKRPCYGLFFKTLDLQVRFARPPSAHRTSSSSCSGVSHDLFMISHHRPCGRWCFARLIRQAETLELQLHSQPPSKRTALSPPKRSCFRFASLTLRWAGEAPLPPYSAPKCSFGTFRCSGRLFFEKAMLWPFLQNARPSGSLRSPSGGRGKLRSPLHPSLLPPEMRRQTGGNPPLREKLSYGARNEFLARSAYPQEAWSFLRTPPRPAAKRAASTRAATPLPPPASSFFLTARSSFRTSRRP